MRKRAMLGVALAGLLASCASVPVDFDANDVGAIKGELLVVWVESDKFVYYPAPSNPLRYVLPARLAAKLKLDAIIPGAMYTDGGSIPKAVQGLAGLSPWGYGPAYVIHDWLFVAHRCIETNQEGQLALTRAEQLDLVRRTTFPDSASVLAGVIGSLVKAKVVQRNGLAPDAIVAAVSSSFAQGLWDQKDPAACQRDLVPAVELRQIEAALARAQGGFTFAAAPASAMLARRAAPPPAPAPTQTSARIVTRQAF